MGQNTSNTVSFDHLGYYLTVTNIYKLALILDKDLVFKNSDEIAFNDTHVLPLLRDSSSIPTYSEKVKMQIERYVIDNILDSNEHLDSFIKLNEKFKDCTSFKCTKDVPRTPDVHRTPDVPRTPDVHRTPDVPHESMSGKIKSHTESILRPPTEEQIQASICHRVDIFQKAKGSARLQKKMSQVSQAIDVEQEARKRMQEVKKNIDASYASDGEIEPTLDKESFEHISN
jgi:hypothetical protein